MKEGAAKMRKNKHFFSCFVSVLLIISIVTNGCSHDDTNANVTVKKNDTAQMQKAQKTPFGKYPKEISYTLGKMTGANNSNMPENDNYENNAYTRYLKEKLNIQNKDVFEVPDEEYDSFVSMAMATGNLPGTGVDIRRHAHLLQHPHADLLGLGLGQLGIFVGFRVIDDGFCLLLGGFHIFEGFDDLLGGGLGILDFHIHQSKSNVILGKNLRYQVFHLHLDVFLAGGQHGIHGGGTDHVAHLALNQVPQNQLRLIGGIEVLHRVRNLIFNEEIHVDDVVVACNHGAFTAIHIVTVFLGGIAQLNFLVYIHVYLFHLLDAQRKAEVNARIGHAGNFAEGSDHGLLLVVHGVVAGGDQQQQHKDHDDRKDRMFYFFPVGLLLFFRRGPAVGSVFFHCNYSFSRFSISASARSRRNAAHQA